MSGYGDIIGCDDQGGYIHYPAPVEEAAVSYDQMFMAAVEGTGVVVVANIPNRAAIYWGTYSVSSGSPLRSDELATRERGLVRITTLLGQRVEAALQE